MSFCNNAYAAAQTSPQGVSVTSHMLQQKNHCSQLSKRMRHWAVHCREQQLTRGLRSPSFAVQPLQLLPSSHQLLRLLLRLHPCQETGCEQLLSALLRGKCTRPDLWHIL